MSSINSSLRNFGKLLKEARILKGLTQKELADKLNVTQGYVAACETGRKILTNPHLLFTWANILDLDESKIRNKAFQINKEVKAKKKLERLLKEEEESEESKDLRTSGYTGTWLRFFRELEEFKKLSEDDQGTILKILTSNAIASIISRNPSLFPDIYEFIRSAVVMLHLSSESASPESVSSAAAISKLIITPLPEPLERILAEEIARNVPSRIP